MTKTINIEPMPDSSIINNIEIVLSDYTVLAGENNSGKTSIIKGIINTLGKENIIYIPAENINADDAAKTTAALDPMRDAISRLLSITLEEVPAVSGKFDNLFKNIETAFSSFNVASTKLELRQKPFLKNEYEKILKDAMTMKMLDHAVIDSYYGSDKKLKFGQVGQGIQRLIIAAILQEIGKAKLSGDDLLILFEEPEIYLHPNLKEALHASLVKLSEQPNVHVVVTTHDPYFIQLASDKKSIMC